MIGRRFLFTRRLAAFLALPLLISLACSGLPGASPTESPAATQPAGSAISTAAPEGAPTEALAGTPPDELILEATIVFGPGPFVFTDTRAGLSSLASYKATLTHSFEGTQEGTPVNWSSTYVMLATGEPIARQWTLETTGQAANPGPVFMAQVEGVEYERLGEEPCSANAVEEGDALADRLELAAFLTGVIGAEEAGSETVNDIAANHYTFDQRALGEEGVAQSTGELWVASEGGYIVRYLLTTQAGADYFGEGIEGTLTLDYELTDSNQPISIVLPEDCPPGMVNAPMLPDASNIVQVPGFLAYDTATSLADAAAYYQEQLPGLGWVAEGEPASAETTTILSYTQGEQSLTVILTAEAETTSVNIMLAPLGQ